MSERRTVHEVVISDLVPFSPDSTNELRVSHRPLADDEERGVGCMLSQDRENLRRVLRIGTVIE
jgi:hypothetical protein